jgi:hypothetical protein
MDLRPPACRVCDRRQKLARAATNQEASSQDLKDAGRKLGASLVGTFLGTPTRQSTLDEQQTA